MHPFVKHIATALLDWTPLATALAALERRSENRLTEFGMLSHAFEFAAINKVSGDYFEFGLWRGKTFSYAHRMKRRHRFTHMLMWGFDSFQGLPPVTPERDNIWETGEFSCSEDELIAILTRQRIPRADYTLVPGFYKDSLGDTAHRQLAGRTAAVVYVDCDLYESTIQVLNFLPPYLVNGTVLCFDDYYCYKAARTQGQQRAIAEFLAAHSDVTLLPYLPYGPTGHSFIVRRDEPHV